MAEHDNFEAVSDGDQLNEGYFNEAFYSRNVKQVYAGTAFNCSVISGATTDTNYLELDAISATELQGANYVKVSIYLYSDHDVSSSGSQANASTYIAIHAKEIGGSYSPSAATARIHYTQISDGEASQSHIAPTIVWYHTLTAGEKSAGVQLKIGANCAVTFGSGAGESILTNRQTIVETKL